MKKLSQYKGKELRRCLIWPVRNDRKDFYLRSPGSYNQKKVKKPENIRCMLNVLPGYGLGT